MEVEGCRSAKTKLNGAGAVKVTEYTIVRSEKTTFPGPDALWDEVCTFTVEDEVVAPVVVEVPPVVGVLVLAEGVPVLVEGLPVLADIV
jgi:hypothetical protein